jgi:hypothetical protein
MKSVARKGEFHQPIQRDLGRPDCASKIIRFSFPPNQSHLRAIPPHEEGRTRRHDTWSAGCGGRDGVARARHCRAASSLSWGCERSIRAGRAAQFAYGKSVWFWHPWLVSSWRRFSRVQPGSQNRQSGSDGGKRNSSPGRARHKPSNHCAGKAGCSPLDLYARVRTSLCTLHTRPRVQRAPGLPCALVISRDKSRRINSGRASPASVEVRLGLLRPFEADLWSSVAGFE